MSYPKQLTDKVEESLAAHEVSLLQTPNEVQDAINSHDAVFVFVDSMCGCSARVARPAAVSFASQQNQLPVASVFAGVRDEATQALRDMTEFPPSSPAFMLFEEGSATEFIPREEIVGRTPEELFSYIKEVVSGSKGI